MNNISLPVSVSLARKSYFHLSYVAVGMLTLVEPLFAQEAKPSAKPVEIDFVKETGFAYGPWRSCVMGGGGYVQNVVPCPSNPKRFYAYIDVGGIFRSDDGGKSWRMLHGALPAGNAQMEVRGLIVDPRDDNKITIATGSHYVRQVGGVFVSTDAGKTFKKVLEALYAGNGSSRSQGLILARDAKNPDRIVTAAIDNGVYLSTDNGETWASIGGKNLCPTDVRFDRTNPNRIWLCTSSEKYKEIKHSKGFYRSDDGGVTWQQLATTDSPSEIVQDPKNAGELFGIFDAAIIKKSTDGGQTWVSFSEGLPVEALAPGQFKQPISPTGYRAITTGPDFILTGPTSNTQFFKLPSGGTKWQKVEDKQAPEIGDWFHESRVFGWAMGSITVNPHDPAHWFITDYFAIYQTHDSGKTWRLTNDGIETTVAHCVLQDPSDPGVVHVGVADVGAFTSTNGGTRMRHDAVPNFGPDRAGGGNMKCMDLSPKLPSRVYGVANRNSYMGWRADQVYVSVDRGQTWHRSPMTGLPDLAKNPATTIVADLNDPYTVYVTVGGKIGNGGVYKSTDGGASWAAMNEGLTKGEYCFPYDIWGPGRQLAVGLDGTLIALNSGGNKVYRFDPKNRQWSTTPLRAKKGKLWSVVADRLKNGRFFIGARGDGLYRTDDNGLNWTQLYDKGASFVATDGAVAGRVAGGTQDGVILSTDGGDTWKMLDQSLPYRHDNMPGFAGERLVVGSLGNGAFWMPLSKDGEKPVVAKPLVSETIPVSNKLLPVLQNGSFETPIQNEWILEQTSGTASIDRDTKIKRHEAASLRITLSEGGPVSLSQDIKITRRFFALSGMSRSQGTFKNARIMLTPFDEKDQPLGGVEFTTFRVGGASWGEFSQMVALPASAVRCRVRLQFEGTGQIWLDNFKISAIEPIFPE